VDRFIYTATNQSTVAAPDIITDFLEGTDRIDLSPIDASTLLFGNQAFSFQGTGPFLLPG
jgi:serralysin